MSAQVGSNMEPPGIYPHPKGSGQLWEGMNETSEEIHFLMFL